MSMRLVGYPLALLALASASMLGAILGNTLLVQPALRPPVSIDPRDLSLGESWASDKSRHGFTVRNDSAEAVHVEFLTSCGCTALSPSKLTLEPGQSSSVEMTLDTLNYLGSFDTKGKKSISLTVEPRVSRHLLRIPGWEFTGQVRLPVFLEANSISVGEVFYTEVPEPQRIEFRTCEPSAQVTAHFEAGWANLELQRNDREHYELTFRPTMPPPVGEIKDVIRIDVNLEDGRPVGSSKIQVTGRSRFAVEAVPDSLYLGTMPVGSEISEIVTLNGAANRPFEVVQYAARQSDVAVRPVEIIETEEANLRTFEISLAVDEPGARLASAEFEVVDSATGRSHTVRAEIHYRGGEPQPRP